MFKRLIFLLRIYVRLQLLHLRSHLEYEADFWIGIIGALFYQGAGFVFLWTVFQRIPEVAGWTLWEVTILYALTIIPRGMAEVVCDGQWRLRQLVNGGDFDRVLIRPLSPALQVVTQFTSIHGFGSVILGVLIIVQALGNLQIEWSGWHYAFLIGAIINGTILIGAVNYITNMIAFWNMGGNNIFPVMVHNCLDFVKFPISLYGGVVQQIITWVVPFAFVSYYPGLVLLGKTQGESWYILASLFSGPIMVALTALLWSRALAHYESTGN